MNENKYYSILINKHSGIIIKYPYVSISPSMIKNANWCKRKHMLSMIIKPLIDEFRICLTIGCILHSLLY